MSAFPKMVLTNAGIVLQTKVQSGITLEFTRIGLGDGNLNGQPISPLTKLINQKASVPINDKKIINSSTLQVSGFFSNQDIQTGFYWREFGVFANDPDEGEILYAYSNAGSAGDYIPTIADQRIEKYIYASFAVQNAENVNITIPQSDTFIPSKEKGVAGGVASLDSSGKVPETQLPELDFIPNSEKGAAGGVAELGEDGKLKAEQAPTNVINHIANKQNPHGVTAAQVGAYTKEETNNLVDESIPTGSVIWYTNSSVPDGFLICDGSAISRTTYSALFNVIGTTFGSGNGSTTFKLPNLINKYIKGANAATKGNSGSTIDYYRYDSYLVLDIKNPLTTVSENITMSCGEFLNNTFTQVPLSHYTIEPPNVCLIPCIKY